MNTRLSFLSRNVTPDNMATSSTVHVDQKIVNEVLSAAKSDTIAKTHTQRMQDWRKFIVPIPAPQRRVRDNPDSRIWPSCSAFYSATVKFVTLLASIPHGGAWVRGGQDLTVHDTWSNSQLQALVKAHASSSYQGV